MTVATATLLNPDDPLFDWQHAMSTRSYLSVMDFLAAHSVVPYLLEPTYETNVFASKWHLNHQQSHNDFNRSLPALWNAPLPFGDGFGIPTSQILIDSSSANKESWTWWTFMNFQEHYIADQAILPLPTELSTIAPTDPWWWTHRGPVIYPFW